MVTIPSEVRLDLLIEAVQHLSFWLDGSGAHMAVVPNGGLPNEVTRHVPIVKALEEIATLRDLGVLHIMVNRLLPGVDVPVHRDFLLPTPLQDRKHPTIERWHLPVVTNDGCLWWDKVTGNVHFPRGMWTGPVPYWNRHKVCNSGQTERIHLVVDLDTPVRLGEYQN